MGVEALERRGIPGAADPELERRPAVGQLVVDEPATDRALLFRRPLEIRMQGVVRLDCGAPPLHPTGGLEARDRGDEVAAREPVRRRERLPLGGVGRLLRHRGTAERAADDDALRADLGRASAEQRAIRRGLVDGEGPDGGAALELGIGGSRKPEALKCLHAHVAFALARPGYRVGEAILDEVPEQWPAKCCTDLSLASPR